MGDDSEHSQSFLSRLCKFLIDTFVGESKNSNRIERVRANKQREKERRRAEMKREKQAIANKKKRLKREAMQGRMQQDNGEYEWRANTVGRQWEDLASDDGKEKKEDVDDGKASEALLGKGKKAKKDNKKNKTEEDDQEDTEEEEDKRDKKG